MIPRRDAHRNTGRVRNGLVSLRSSSALSARNLLHPGKSDEAALVFHHMEADARFGVSVFWTRRSGAIGGEQAMIEYWQVRREGGHRGIVEIVPEET